MTSTLSRRERAGPTTVNRLTTAMAGTEGTVFPTSHRARATTTKRNLEGMGTTGAIISETGAKIGREISTEIRTGRKTIRMSHQ